MTWLKSETSDFGWERVGVREFVTLKSL